MPRKKPRIKRKLRLPASRKGNEWFCSLECGHAVHRRIRSRLHKRTQMVLEDPPPKWAYCEFCSAGWKWDAD